MTVDLIVTDDCGRLPPITPQGLAIFILATVLIQLWMVELGT
jgi:hypothetical protein